MKPVDRIFSAFDAGYPALLVTGRSLYDLTAASDGKLRPLLEVLRRAARVRYGMWLVTYSLAGGLDWSPSRLEDDRDRRAVESALRSHGLLDIPADQNELVRVIRGLSSLARTPASLKWADGGDLRFLLVVEFADHLVPGALSPGTQTDSQLVAIELAHLLGQSLALRASGNALIFHGREGLIDELVVGALHPVRLPQPGREEKLEFLRAALALYPSASFEPGLDAEAVAFLTTNTPNRGLEALLRASHRTGHPITARMLAEQKHRDVEQLSEHTLTVLDASRANNAELHGRNIAAPRAILTRYAEALLRADAAMPANVLLVGPPGTGKTDLAVLVARRAKAAAYQMLSPKGALVGETERKARVQQNVLREWIPNVAFVDEITEAFPLERSSFDGDSGASRAVLAALLTALSDESRRGRSLLIATTNCPWRMGAAMRSRFTMIPVLYPLAEDFPAIVVALAHRLNAKADIDADRAEVQEAARVFYSKGASPRHILSALSNALMLHGELTSKTVLFAAHDLCPSSDLASVIYADLWAVRACSSRSFFPWAEAPENYPYPDHLRGAVDPETGAVRVDELDKRLRELEPHANV
jgi:AAA+ superfamily predicted ATPase